ncbi:MAG: VanZ family protein [Thermodesulfobacteriota bacterium]
MIFLSLIPGPGIGGGQYLDKIAHAIFYSVMGVLAYIAFETVWKRIIIFIFIFLLGISLEFFQIYVPGRGASVYDVLANTSGLILSFLLCWIYTLIPDTPPPGAGETRE